MVFYDEDTLYIVEVKSLRDKYGGVSSTSKFTKLQEQVDKYTKAALIWAQNKPLIKVVGEGYMELEDGSVQILQNQEQKEKQEEEQKEQEEGEKQGEEDSLYKGLLNFGDPEVETVKTRYKKITTESSTCLLMVRLMKGPIINNTRHSARTRMRTIISKHYEKEIDTIKIILIAECSINMHETDIVPVSTLFDGSVISFKERPLQKALLGMFLNKK
jgi:hypothetical protein